ncbi:MAG: hypothetical protein ABWZ64_07790, partial [Xanthobacteraceae bacterium]
MPLVDALNKGPLITSDPENDNWQGYCLVQRFEAGALSTTGHRVTLTLRACSVGLSLDRIYISQADLAVGMDLYDLGLKFPAKSLRNLVEPGGIEPP